MIHKILVQMMVLLIIANPQNYCQTEIKGSGNTGTTITMLTKNSSSDTSMIVRDNGKIGIGITNPTQKLQVQDTIFSSLGGFQFPDGTVMSTATYKYGKVFTVALTGGDFTSIQNALNACVGASRANPFLVQVMPGVYNEPIINCLSFVDLRGSGKHSCTITGTVMGADSCNIENFFIQNGIVCNGTSPFIMHNIITRKDGDNAIGIYITNPGRPWIKENEIRDCSGYGIVCNGFGADAWIIGNKLLFNEGGGIRCQDSSPTISNNFIDHNDNYGVYVAGNNGTPSEPTIDDNIIGHTTNSGFHGIGVAISFFAEPRVIANDIYLNDVGIEIDPPSQPSVISNNINYNIRVGIACYSNGASKRVVIMGNHIHSNTGTQSAPPGLQPAGIFIGNCNPMITQNNITQNRRAGSTFFDIDYSSCISVFPTISLNVFDFINPMVPSGATGLYNTTQNGAAIAP
jgi:hypothetical protein